MNQINRRLLRLENFFEPYTQFKLIIDADLQKPITIKTKDNSSSKKFRVKISSSLLEEDNPLWVESTLFSYARTYADQYYHDPKKAEELAQTVGLFAELQKLFQDKLQKQVTIEEESINDTWLRLRKEYFPDKEFIDEYQVIWSDRNQKSLLASCNVERNRVEVAKALDHPSCETIIEPLLYHEMCHAALGRPKVVKGRRIMHGKDFKELEKRHPRISFLNSWIKSGNWDAAVTRYEKEKVAA